MQYNSFRGKDNSTEDADIIVDDSIEDTGPSKTVFHDPQLIAQNRRITNARRMREQTNSFFEMPRKFISDKERRQIERKKERSRQMREELNQEMKQEDDISKQQEKELIRKMEEEIEEKWERLNLPRNVRVAPEPTPISRDEIDKEIERIDRENMEKLTKLGILRVSSAKDEMDQGTYVFVPDVACSSRTVPISFENPARTRLRSEEPIMKYTCLKERCIRDPSFIDNYNHTEQLQTAVQPVWFTTSANHLPSVSSRDISTFITRENTNLFAQIDAVGTQQLHEIAEFERYKAAKGDRVEYQEIALTVDFSSFPQQLSDRSGDLRPIFLDGIGVARAWDYDFIPCSPEHVLPVYPIVFATLRLTLLGHKVQIVLPKFYKESCRVDNIYAIQKLSKLKLIEWIQENARNSENFRELIEKLSMETCAFVVSNDRNEQFCNPDKTPENDDNYCISKYVKKTALKKHQIHFPSERFLGIQFFDEKLGMAFYKNSYDYVALNQKNVKGEEGYYVIEPREIERETKVIDTRMCYTNMEGDVNDDDPRRLSNQITFQEQIFLVLELADLYAWHEYDLRGVMVFLRFAYQNGYQKYMFAKFLQDHPPLPEPSVSDLESPAAEETPNANFGRNFFKDKELEDLIQEALRLRRSRKARH